MSTFPLSVFLLTSCFLHYYVRRGSSNSLEVPMWNSVSLLFVVENRKKSLISIAQALFLPLTDFGLFMAWSPVILLAFNVSTQTTYGVTLGFSILQSLAICLSTCIITYFGRRRVLIWSGAVMMLFQVINLIHFLVIKFAAHNIELIRIKFKYWFLFFFLQVVIGLLLNLAGDPYYGYPNSVGIGILILVGMFLIHNGFLASIRGWLKDSLPDDCKVGSLFFCQPISFVITIAITWMSLPLFCHLGGYMLFVMVAIMCVLVVFVYYFIDNDGNDEI